MLVTLAHIQLIYHGSASGFLQESKGFPHLIPGETVDYSRPLSIELSHYPIYWSSHESIAEVARG